MTEEQNSGGKPSNGEARGRRTDLGLEAADIASPLLVRIIERREDAVLVEDSRGRRVEIHPSVFADNHIGLGEDELLLPTGVCRHYFGKEALRLTAAREREDLALLRGHLWLILSARDRILQSPYLSSCYSPAWRIGGIPVGPGDYLSLGVLEGLWGNGRLLMECPECAGTAYIYYLIGSYLSGRNSAHGYCPRCERFVRRPAPDSRSLGQFRAAIKDVSQELYLGGGAPLWRGAGAPGAAQGRPPRLLYPRDLQPPEDGCPSLRMVIEELASARS